MKKNLFTFICILLFKPLSAQVDSGFSKCLADFKTSVSIMDSMHLDEEESIKNCNVYQQKYFECIYNKQAPDFSGVTINNDSVKFCEIKNKVILLNFWEVNCPPCMAELGILNELYDEYKKKGVVFISICLDTQSKILKRYKPRIPTIPAGKDILNLFCITGYPENLIISKTHKIKKVLLGCDINNTQGLKEEIEFYLNKTLKETE